MEFGRTKILPTNFVIDLDGIFTDGKFYYSEQGKIFKVFGADDHDAVNILKNYLQIDVVTADAKGFKISEKRIKDDMNLPLHLVGVKERLDWIKGRFNLGSTIYMGDGIYDSLIFKDVFYSIAPRDAFYLTKKNASFITECNGGERAVAEASFHILTKFFTQSYSEILKH